MATATDRIATARVRWDDDIVGKTIAAAREDGVSFGMRFSDGTWYFVGLDGDECPHCSGVCLDDMAEPMAADLFHLGLIDQAEFDRRVAAERAKVAGAERAEYERLRAKFEKADAGEEI